MSKVLISSHLLLFFLFLLVVVLFDGPLCGTSCSTWTTTAPFLQKSNRFSFLFFKSSTVEDLPIPSVESIPDKYKTYQHDEEAKRRKAKASNKEKSKTAKSDRNGSRPNSFYQEQDSPHFSDGEDLEDPMADKKRPGGSTNILGWIGSSRKKAVTGNSWSTRITEHDSSTFPLFSISMLASVTTASEEKEERPPEDFIFGGEAGAVFQNELFEDEEAQRNPTPGKPSSLLPPLSPLLPCPLPSPPLSLLSPVFTWPLGSRTFKTLLNSLPFF